MPRKKPFEVSKTSHSLQGVKRILAPVERFLAIVASSGILLTILSGFPVRAQHHFGTAIGEDHLLFGRIEAV